MYNIQNENLSKTEKKMNRENSIGEIQLSRNRISIAVSKLSNEVRNREATDENGGIKSFYQINNES